jgi:hypothetical protein
VRRAAASAALCPVILGLVATPAEAAEHRSDRHITAGTGWLGKHTSWLATTTARQVRGSRDSARLCSSRAPLTANFRIYAYDSHGRLLASRAGDLVRFGCRTLTAPQRTTRFVFRLNVQYDGAGETSWAMSAR